MKKFLLVLGGALLLGNLQTQAQSRPDKCGMQHMHEAMIAKDPSWEQKFADQRASLQACADYHKQQMALHANERTTTTISAVPIIFHIIVDSAQFNALGGTIGITKRCDSQIAVLNRDFNMENPDSTYIPSGWKPYYGNTGIHFGLAHVDPSGNCSPGYEVKIISGTSLTDAGYDVLGESTVMEKYASTGLAAWDVTKYYNVWCINYTGSSTSLLGLTQPKYGLSGTHVNEEGVDILYNTLGCTAYDGTIPSGTGGAAGWFMPYNLGRTLTHETGHFFEIWHPWGDDNGKCSTWSSDSTVVGSGLVSGEDAGITCHSGTGQDDGITDTPPESDAVYGNPTYTIIGGTTNDCCEHHGSTNTQPIGIACLSYMDYTDDDAMHMFTVDQAAAMASMVLDPPASGHGADNKGTIGENYSLTQNPSLLVACGTTTVTAVAAAPEVATNLNIFPNPTTGQVTITLNALAVEVLNQIIVIDLLGQEVMTINGQNKDFYTLDLSAMSKGIYFIKCNFSSGNNITKKILLQ